MLGESILDVGRCWKVLDIESSKLLCFLLKSSAGENKVQLSKEKFVRRTRYATYFSTCFRVLSQSRIKLGMLTRGHFILQKFSFLGFSIKIFLLSNIDIYLARITYLDATHFE